MLSTGFSALWKNVVDKDGLDVRLKSPVVQIERLGEKTRVHYKQLQVGDSAEYEVGKCYLSIWNKICGTVTMCELWGSESWGTNVRQSCM